MNLVSIVNSGEALEKALALGCFALSNKENDFYDQYDKIIVYYGENLPKKETSLNTLGTLGGCIHYLNNKKLIPYKKIEDLFDDKRFIIDRLIVENRISERIAEKIYNNDDVFMKIAVNSPWDIICRDQSTDFISLCKQMHPKLELRRLTFQDDFSLFLQTIPMYSKLAKLFVLNYDSVISTRHFGKQSENSVSKKGLVDIPRNSIVQSGNVYAFLIRLNQLAKEHFVNYTLGYKPMTKFPRKSYDLAMRYLMETNETKIIEPGNQAFIKELKKVKTYSSREERITKAIYNVLNDFI